MRKYLETDPQGLGAEDARNQVAVLTGRLMQLEYILTTPDNFLRLAEQLETNGQVLSPPVREPVL